MEDAMIAYLPSDGSWCKQDFPHMTLVYAGKIAEMAASDFNTLAKDAITCGRLTSGFRLEISGLEVFGPEGEQVDVLTFMPTPKLVAARQIVQYWNKSEFTDFNPHATIGPAGSASSNPLSDPSRMGISNQRGYPLSLYFNQIAACWGNERLIFNLGSDY